MSDPTRPRRSANKDESEPADSEARIVQANRFELVDRQGRLRAVLGDVGGAGDGFEPGLELMDLGGSCRVFFAVHGSGPRLSLTMGGNEVIGVGVCDDSRDSPQQAPSDNDAVTYLFVADGQGRAVLRWAVHHDGRIEATPPRPDLEALPPLVQGVPALRLLRNSEPTPGGRPRHRPKKGPSPPA